MTNRGQSQKIVFVRHTLADGWTLGEGHKVFEKQGEAHLFRVEVPAGASKTIVVEAHTPMTRTVDLRSSVGVDLMRDYLDTHPDNRDFVAAMRTILNMHTDMAKAAARISGLQAKMGEYRNRASELTTQIERLDMAGAGRKLKAHLEAKLKEVSIQIQRGTIEAVELQESQMLTRIRFQDAAAELTLDPPTRTADKT